MITAPKIETQRLLLDPITINHTKAIIQVRSDAEAVKWSTYGPVTTIPEAKTFLSKFFINNSPTEPHRFAWAVHLPNDTENCIGHVCLMGQQTSTTQTDESDSQAESQAEYNIGYMFIPSMWNQGYATEAMEGVMEVMAAKLRPARFWAWIDIANAGSIRVAEKLGFLFVERRVLSSTPRSLAGEMREDAMQIYRRDV